MDIMPPDNQLPPHHAPTGLKLWLAVFGVVLVLALGYFVWVANTSPDTTEDPTAVTKKTTTDETAGWRSYTNTRVAYAFEYPSSGLTLNLDETIKYPSAAASDSKTEDLVQYATKTMTYSVRTEVGVAATSVETWFSSFSGDDISKNTKTTIGGKAAYTLNGQLLTYVMSGSNVYIITAFDGVAPSTKTSDSTYAHLLSSFKFTN